MRVMAFSNRLAKNISFEFPQSSNFCTATIKDYFKELMKWSNVEMNTLNVRFAYKSDRWEEILPTKHAKKQIINK